MHIGKLHLNNRYFLAPLAGISNLPFRLINKEYGCSLVYTEMISAQGLVRAGKKTIHLLKSDEKEKPITFQIFGSDPRALAKAAKICEDYGADIVDINMGCPVKKVIRNGAGCALLNNPEKVKNIIASVRSAIDIPLTIKLRLGMDNENLSYLEISKIAQVEGADAICLHPRTKNQMFKGEIDIEALKMLKENVDIPVIGSGNLFDVNDVEDMFEKTGCDAVMIARGALGHPFIFKKLIDTLDKNEEFTPPSILQIKRIILKHIEYFLRYYPEKVCHKEMKKHMVWYTKGFEGSSSFRKKVVTTKDLNQMTKLLEEYFESLM
jgi:nifR3 family TIM-barrel protein